MVRSLSLIGLLLARRIKRPKAAMVAASASAEPLVAIITGSNTTGTLTRSGCSSRAATASNVSTLPIMPIFTRMLRGRCGG